jgi:hypothetical protein
VPVVSHVEPAQLAFQIAEFASIPPIALVEHTWDDLVRFWNTLERFGTTVPRDKYDVNTCHIKTYNQNTLCGTLDPQKVFRFVPFVPFFSFNPQNLKKRPLYQTFQGSIVRSPE